MSRSIPVDCPHGRMIDGGDFVEPNQIEGCAECGVFPAPTAGVTGPVPDDVIDAVAAELHFAVFGFGVATAWRDVAKRVFSVPAVTAVFARDTQVRELATEVAWLAKLARGSSWPLDMAEHVERAADRVIREFGTDADRADLAARYAEDGAR